MNTEHHSVIWGPVIVPRILQLETRWKRHALIALTSVEYPPSFNYWLLCVNLSVKSII
jgi:hypothetical protein